MLRTVVVLVVQLVSRHSCVADRLPVVVRSPAGPRVRLKTVDPPKGNGLGQKKKQGAADGTVQGAVQGAGCCGRGAGCCGRGAGCCGRGAGCCAGWCAGCYPECGGEQAVRVRLSKGVVQGCPG